MLKAGDWCCPNCEHEKIDRTSRTTVEVANKAGECAGCGTLTYFIVPSSWNPGDGEYQPEVEDPAAEVPGRAATTLPPESTHPLCPAGTSQDSGSVCGTGAGAPVPFSVTPIVDASWIERMAATGYRYMQTTQRIAAIDGPGQPLIAPLGGPWELVSAAASPFTLEVAPGQWSAVVVCVWVRR